MMTPSEIQQREQLQGRCARQAVQINEKNAEIERLRREISEKDQTIAELRGRIAGADAELANGERIATTAHADYKRTAVHPTIGFVIVHERCGDDVRVELKNHPHTYAHVRYADLVFELPDLSSAAAPSGEQTNTQPLSVATPTRRPMDGDDGKGDSATGSSAPARPAEEPDPREMCCCGHDRFGHDSEGKCQRDKGVHPMRNTTAANLHAAQLGARAHVVPHLRAAAETALDEGRQADFEAFTAIAMLVDGAFDPAILRYGEAFLRFVKGVG